jgi:hypothetical protein
MSEVTVAVRPRITDISATNLIYESENPAETGEPGYRYIHATAGNGQSFEWRMTNGDDIEQWCDETGCEWPPDMRDQLARILRTPVERTVIDARTSVDMVEQRDEAIKAVLKFNNPPMLFQRGGKVTEVVRDEDNVPTAQIVSVPRMRDRLAEVALWSVWTPSGPKPVKPPQDIATTLLVTPGMRANLPRLAAITEFPVVGRNGRINTRRGYQRDSGYYFAPSRPLPRLELCHPRLALSWLDEVIRDFTLVGSADRAHVYALMLTPILRPLIDGPVPMAAVSAVKPGTGKTLLVESALSVLTGRVPAFVRLGRDEDEAEKRIFAALLSGQQFVVFDNVKTGTVLESAALADALTASSWAGRIIRSSDFPELPIRATWAATGNNLTLSDEISRRSYLIELDAKVERPDLRPASDFAHPGLRPWVMANRPALLSSILSLPDYWHEMGMPIHDVPMLSKFEEWSRIVGSVLFECGVFGFLGNEERKREIAEDDTNLNRTNLIRALYEATGGREFTLRDVWERTRLQADGPLGTAVLPFLDDRTTWEDEHATRQLGNRLRSFLRGNFAGYRLVRVGDGKKGAVLQVVVGDGDTR